MTARMTFPAVPAGDAAPCAPAAPEAALAVAVLRLWQAHDADGPSRLCAAFGPRQGCAVLHALDRLARTLDGSGADARDPVALGLLVGTSLHGPDAEERARMMALALVPPHGMPPLMQAARDLGLVLRRAVLVASGGPTAGCPAHAARGAH